MNVLDYQHDDEDGDGVSTSSYEEGTSEATERTPTQEKNQPEIAQKETLVVNRTKLLVYTVLLLVAGVAAVGTYWIIDQSEQDEFKQQFDNNAQEFIRGSEENAKNIFADAIKVSEYLTSFAMATNATWPFVTLPNFEAISAKTFNSSAGAELLMFAPWVARQDRRDFESYAQANQAWIQQDLRDRGDETDPGKIAERIYFVSKDDDVETDFLAPLWQIAPAPTNASILLKDIYSQASFRRMIDDVLIQKDLLLSEVVDQEALDKETEGVDYFRRGDQPSSYATVPVFDSFDEETKQIVGFLFAVVPWDLYFGNILSDSAQGISIEVEDTCGSLFTYTVTGPEATFENQGGATVLDEFERLKQSTDFAKFARFTGTPDLDYLQFCNYELSVYPTEVYKEEYTSDEPIWFALAVAAIFLVTSSVFCIFDMAVAQRQRKVMASATRTKAIVASMFPENVQERIFEEAERTTESRFFSKPGQKKKLKAFLNDGYHDAEENETKPIADLFPEVTIMFADIAGFTAWSSTRQPHQVFTLLETLFSAFDKLAKRRRIFKVETVGDCYVAACGLPDPNPKHAVFMARFACDCLSRFNKLAEQLEESLGPDTADLSLRVGLHSGSVTAGVLRGDRARFQLFGDAMNTASRMESTGTGGRIHVSQATYDILKHHGKESWLREREEKVLAKGKGNLQTYWLTLGSTSTSPSQRTHETPESVVHDLEQDIVRTSFNAEKKVWTSSTREKDKRLVKWNTDVLLGLLREIAAARGGVTQSGGGCDDPSQVQKLETESENQDRMVFEQVVEVISLPHFDADKSLPTAHPEEVDLGKAVVDEAFNYVRAVSLLYKKNPFHNFEHASHVANSVVKLLSRIIAPENYSNDNQESLHDHTYGITSDPLTRFAVFISALIHDAGHEGVPNTQLIEEKQEIAAAYQNKSVAEQNSIDLCWSMLMREEYKNLRHAIYGNSESDFLRFRQLLVNVVLATDIMDKELKVLRNTRWDKAFNAEEQSLTHGRQEGKKSVDRKATIVLEHLIQASDVAHTMQHWQIYRKWNQRLFNELAKAYEDGRAKTHPSEFWYEGELGFFDFYIIPLAKKLDSCGVFGVSSDEYLSYAVQNREEWAQRGKEMVQEYVQQLMSGTS